MYISTVQVNLKKIRATLKGRCTICRDTSVLHPRQNAKLDQSDSNHYYSSRESEMLRSGGKFENVELKQVEVNPRQRRHFTLLCLNLTCSAESVNNFKGIEGKWINSSVKPADNTKIFRESNKHRIKILCKHCSQRRRWLLWERGDLYSKLKFLVLLIDNFGN